jgi:hypothetical protein
MRLVKNKYRQPRRSKHAARAQAPALGASGKYPEPNRHRRGQK